MSRAPVAGAVLTGGASRRMGRDKALLPVDGVAMAARVAAALRDAGCSPVTAIGGDRSGLEALGLAVVDDPWPGEGPLGGILAALGAAEEAVVVVACDLPWLDAATVTRVVAAEGIDLERTDVVVASSGRREPLCARWQPSARDTLRRAFADGERAVHRAMAMLRVAEVAVDPHRVADADTPEDLDRGDPGSDTPSATGAATTAPTSGNVPAMPIREVSIDELDAALAAGARVIDVRETDEYVAGHVAGAVHVALGTVPDHVDVFRGEPVPLVICAAGGRSMRVCEFLAGQGIEAVNVAGGTKSWIQSGRPVVAGDSPT